MSHRHEFSQAHSSRDESRRPRAQLSPAFVQQVLALADARDKAVAPGDLASVTEFVDERRELGWSLIDILADCEQSVAASLGVPPPRSGLRTAQDPRVERVMNYTIRIVLRRYHAGPD
ncbi:MAG TPA: hypothetical protein VF159_13145 [Gemmatimonadaceae bacterium]